MNKGLTTCFTEYEWPFGSKFFSWALIQIKKSYFVVCSRQLCKKIESRTQNQ